MPAKEEKRENVQGQVKPFLKWAGSKRQLLKRFEELYPASLKAGKIKNYYEPFLGSGAVFFDIVQRYNIEQAWLYDVNDDLVLTYSVIKKDVSGLLDFLFKVRKRYLSLTQEKRDDYFYAQRALFNANRQHMQYEKYAENWIPRAAQFIFLNRTCFNGLYRVNAKGEFNTPAGDYANPTIYDEENLLAVSKILDRAILRKADFNEVLKDVKRSSFIYFDPPYRPLGKTASFTAYNQSMFAEPEQLRLADMYKKLDKKGAQIMLSNSDPGDQFFDALYGDFTITRVPAKRLINANAAGRGAINEIIVTNYPLNGKKKNAGSV